MYKLMSFFKFPRVSTRCFVIFRVTRLSPVFIAHTQSHNVAILILHHCLSLPTYSNANNDIFIHLFWQVDIRIDYRLYHTELETYSTFPSSTCSNNTSQKRKSRQCYTILTLDCSFHRMTCTSKPQKWVAMVLTLFRHEGIKLILSEYYGS